MVSRRSRRHRLRNNETRVMYTSGRVWAREGRPRTSYIYKYNTFVISKRTPFVCKQSEWHFLILLYCRRTANKINFMYRDYCRHLQRNLSRFRCLRAVYHRTQSDSLSVIIPIFHLKMNLFEFWFLGFLPIMRILSYRLQQKDYIFIILF